MPATEFTSVTVPGIGAITVTIQDRKSATVRGYYDSSPQMQSAITMAIRAKHPTVSSVNFPEDIGVYKPVGAQKPMKILVW